MTIARRWVWVAVIVLLVVQAAHVAYVVHRESLSYVPDLEAKLKRL